MEKKVVTIKAPNMQIAEFEIKGTAPLVVHRFGIGPGGDADGHSGIGLPNPDAPKPKNTGKNKVHPSTDQRFNAARYISKEGWDGFHAGAVRAAMISACRLVNFKMTLAKLSIFVVADGWDAAEPQIPLVRIYGDPVKQLDICRVETGQPYVNARPAYHNWSAKIKIRFDGDQFLINDVYNLLMRVGLQVGLCEGRPDSKKSAGMGWGLFEVSKAKLLKS